MNWPAGFHSGASQAGFKAEGLDVGLLVADAPASWAGTFTKNAAAAAPVHWSRSLLGRSVRAVVVNSGNANACTGAAGRAAVESTVEAVAQGVGCTSDQVLVASTGPIGVPLQVEKLVAALPPAVSSLDTSPALFAKSILTTDSRTKISSARSGDASILGVAKGAAMLAPNMATMLAFIATDAFISVSELQSVLTTAVSRSFDRLCIDACESTNDSVFLLASGHAQAADDLGERIQDVCLDLAEQMATDAEGATKLVRLAVEGAKSEEHAVQLGRAICASDLWRAAIHGSDPNYGRVLAALGAVDRSLDLENIDVYIGKIQVFNGGEPTGDLELAAKAMEGPEMELTCRVGRGEGSARLLTTDLSPSYVELNAGGTT